MCCAERGQSAFNWNCWCLIVVLPKWGIDISVRVLIVTYLIVVLAVNATMLQHYSRRKIRMEIHSSEQNDCLVVWSTMWNVDILIIWVTLKTLWTLSASHAFSSSTLPAFLRQLLSAVWWVCQTFFSLLIIEIIQICLMWYIAVS